MGGEATSATIPAELRDLLTTDVLGHLVTVRPDGSLAPAIVWVDFDGEHVLFDSPEGSRKGRNVRANPNVALSVVDHRNPFRYLAIRGRVTGIRPDVDLALIDRLSQRYTDRLYGWRDRPREVFEVTIDHVSASGGRRSRGAASAPTRVRTPSGRRIACRMALVGEPLEPDAGRLVGAARETSVMKILVAYASRHGATRGIAERIAQTLGESGYDATCQDVGEVHSAGLYDAFVIGASAYMGHWEKEATAFVRQHSALLSNRPVWIFSSGPVGPDRFDAKGRDQLEAARPREFAELPELVNPRELKIFFGAYDPLRKGGTFVERLVMKAPAIRDAMPAGDFRDWPAIEAWARGIAHALEADRARLAVPV